MFGVNSRIQGRLLPQITHKAYMFPSEKAIVIEFILTSIKKKMVQHFV